MTRTCETAQLERSPHLLQRRQRLFDGATPPPLGMAEMQITASFYLLSDCLSSHVAHASLSFLSTFRAPKIRGRMYPTVDEQQYACRAASGAEADIHRHMSDNYAKNISALMLSVVVSLQHSCCGLHPAAPVHGVAITCAGSSMLTCKRADESVSCRLGRWLLQQALAAAHSLCHSSTSSSTSVSTPSVTVRGDFVLCRCHLSVHCSNSPGYVTQHEGLVCHVAELKPRHAMQA